jgi:hypothetical protein
VTWPLRTRAELEHAVEHWTRQIADLELSGPGFQGDQVHRFALEVARAQPAKAEADLAFLDRPDDPDN